MILLTDPISRSRQDIFAVFGLGLIGSAFVSALKSSAPVREEQLDFHWADPEMQATQAGHLERRLEGTIKSAPSAARIHVVWSAGRAGFGSSRQETDPEFQSFRNVLALTERTALRFPEVPVTFCLMSSAGGLFEGRRQITKDSLPAPAHPYGLLKLEQERLLLGSPAPLRKAIYRLTSVYGLPRPRQRHGLISTLVVNGLRQRVSRIVGFLSTLRDFVCAEDIAEYLTRKLRSDAGVGPDSITVLGSIRPFSILEIQKIVESTLRHKIYLGYSLQASNSEDITFSADVFPSDWHPGDLKSNVRRLYTEALSRGLAFDDRRP
jgi:nucleoside-diphosphate-sugar epimerase